MASIQTAIELYDGLTAPMMDIINAVNMGVSSMYEMNEAMNTPIDTASFDVARENINRAEIAVRELDNAIQAVNGSNIEVNIPAVTAPVEVPFKWQSYNGMEIFTNTGVERFERELASVNSMLEQLNDDQFKITMASNDTDILSPDAAYDIRSVEGKVQSLIEMIRQIEETSLDVGTDDTNANLERLRASLHETINLENRLKESMQGADLSEVNSAFMKLSENITHTEKLVRDTFSEIEIPPVEVPITWKSDNLEVFTNTGVERFQQEIQSANSMLDQLAVVQGEITQRAESLDIIPPEAVTDIQRLQSRIQDLQASIELFEQNSLDIESDEASAKLERLRTQLTQVTDYQENLNLAMDEMNVGDINEAFLRLSQTVGSVERSVRDSFSNPMEISVQWKSFDGLDVFTNTGIERFQQEVASTNAMLGGLSEIQTKISQQASETSILPQQAITDIQNVESRIQNLQQMIEQVENNPLNMGTNSANASLEKLRAQLNQTLALQDNLGQAMQGMDISEINAAYQQLSQNISDSERLVRDSFSNIPSVNVPVHWESDNLEVFTNTGVERFQQEVQSANNMLNTLNQTQTRIAAAAAQTNLFPANAVSDMNGMQTRLQAIRQQIQAIENNPLNIGSDSANAELERLRDQLSQAVSQQENLNRAVENMDVEATNEAYLQLSQTVGNTERYIRDNVDEQGNFNREIEHGTNEANQLMQTIKGAVAAYASIQTAGKIIDLSDTMTQTTARLDLIVDDGGSVEELQNKIYASAQNARGLYQATADAVSKLGLMAGDAFSGTDEIVAFMEQVNKQFTIAGTEASGIDAAMLQLTQAMGSGVLRGEEFNSIMEQAPNIIQAIADYMAVPKGQLKDMAAEGLITSDIVKNAMFAAADETNAKFEQMPMTFSQIGTSFKNTALMAFQPVLKQMNKIANSEDFQNFVDNALNALSAVAEIAVEIFDLLVSVGGMIADNWSLISPIIYGVVAALGAYCVALGVYNAIQAISNGIKAAAAFAEQVHAASLAMESGATFAATAAQYGFNAALLACPITWLIVTIIALIAIFCAVVAKVNEFQGTTISAIGVICAEFMAALAFIGNIFIAACNLIIDVFVIIYNLVATVANFIGNVFTDPIGAVNRLFFDLADTVLGVLQSLASAIDTIFGSNLAGSVQGWRDSLGSYVDETFGKGVEIMAKMNAEDLHLGRFEYGEAIMKGYDFGEGISKKISDFDLSSSFETTAIPSPEDYVNLGGYGDSGINDIGSGVDDIASNTSDIADSMDITEEDLKYLRDIAEKETINRFTTAEIKIEQTNNNTISSEWDLDGVVDGLTEAIDEAVNIITEGVHV